MRVLALKITPAGIFLYRTLNQVAGLNHTIVPGGRQWVEEAAADPPDVVHTSYSGDPGLLAELQALRKLRRVPFVVDCDDLFLRVPDYNLSANAVHPSSPAYRLRVAMLKAADMVTVSTPTLKAMLDAELGLSCVIVPNFIESTWFAGVPLRPKRPGEVRIVFTGASGGRWGDLEMVRPVIQALAGNPNVSICIFGSFPQWALEYPNIHCIRWVPTEDDLYFRLLKHLNADIGLAPLLSNDFNRCKSGIKYYEYAAAGIAGVYSQLDPYAEVREGVTGLLVPDNTEAWMQAVTRLAGDLELRVSIRDNAAADVLVNHAGPSALPGVLAGLVGTDIDAQEVLLGTSA